MARQVGNDRIASWIGATPLDQAEKLNDGAGLGLPRRAPPGGRTLGALATDWLEAKSKLSNADLDTIRARVHAHLRPTPLWATPLRQIRPAMVLGAVELSAYPTAYGIEPAQVRVAWAVLGDIKSMLRFAIATGVIDDSPLLGSELEEELAVRLDSTDQSATVDTARLSRILRDSQFVGGRWPTKLAYRAMALTLQRPACVVAMQWCHLDLVNAAWHEPSRQKGAFIPLTPAMTSMLSQLDRRSPYVFYQHSDPSKPVTLWAIRIMLRRQLGLRFQHSTRDFRLAFASYAKRRALDARSVAFVLDRHAAEPMPSDSESVMQVLRRWTNELLYARG